MTSPKYLEFKSSCNTSFLCQLSQIIWGDSWIQHQSLGLPCTGHQISWSFLGFSVLNFSPFYFIFFKVQFFLFVVWLLRHTGIGEFHWHIFSMLCWKNFYSLTLPFPVFSTFCCCMDLAVFWCSELSAC